MPDTEKLNEQTVKEQPGTDDTQKKTVEPGTDGAKPDGKENTDKDSLQAEVARLTAALAKSKEAINKLAKENGDAKKALRAKQTAEEIAAEEKKEQDEKIQQELAELRKKVARAETVKTVMAKLGTDEEVSGKISDALTGAEDVEAALTEIQRAWTAKEKALRLEFGKIPPPGSGGQNGEDAARQKAIELAKQIGRERANTGKTLKDTLGAYVR